MICSCLQKIAFGHIKVMLKFAGYFKADKHCWIEKDKKEQLHVFHFILIADVVIKSIIVHWF